MYDIAIIGAGINGSSVAYEFLQENKKVIIFDKNAIASGGSGAAGAFISPKFSKTGDLKDMLNEAFVYSMDYYKTNFPNELSISSLIHIAKDKSQNETLRVYKKNTALKLLNIAHSYQNETVCLRTGIVDAVAVCQAMCKGALFVKEEIKSLVYGDGVWVLNESYCAKNIILANGAYKQLIDEPYIKVYGIWGHRIDIRSSTKNEYILHQEVSISPSKECILAIGATHDVDYDPDTNKSYDIQKGRNELLQKAKISIDLQNVEVIKDYTGLRSGSVDYIPFLGSIVISKKTMKNKSIYFETKKANYEVYDYYPNLYMINGSGGYGFVLAPYLANILKEHILNNKKIDNKMNPARFFHKWVKNLSPRERRKYIQK